MRKTFIDVLLELPVDATLIQLVTEKALPVPMGFDKSPDPGRVLLECIRQWQDIPAKDQLIGELTACLPLADAQGRQAIFEAAGNNVALMTEMSACQSDLHRAFWCYRHHPDLFGKALDANFMERKGGQAQQHALGILRHPNTTPFALAAFNQGVSRFYQRRQHCGEGVESTIFPIRPGVFLLTMHVKDLPMMQLEFQGTTVTKRVGNPCIHGMLEYSERTGVVRTLIRGGKDYHQMLAAQFAEHVLGQVVNVERIKPEKIDLSMMRTGIHFPQAIKDGFVAVQIKQIAVHSPSGKLKLECTAMAAAGHDSVTDVLREELPAPLEGEWAVTSVQINLYHPGESGRTRIVTAELTSMGRIRLPMRDPVMKANVERYLVEQGVLKRGQTLEAEDFPPQADLPQPVIEG